MMQLENAPDNAATNHLGLKYIWVVSEYRSFKRQFPEDALKITSFGKDNCRFEQEDAHEKFLQVDIFYLAPNPTIVGGLFVAF